MKFINKLSFEKLRTVLNMCGLFMVDNEEIFNEIKAEEKLNNIECYYFRAMDCNPCLDDTEKLTKEKFYHSLKNLEIKEKLLDYSYLYSAIDIYSVSDFMLCRAFPLELYDGEFPTKRDLELQEKFISVMAKTFKNQNYQSKYDEFVNATLAEENEISQEK